MSKIVKFFIKLNRRRFAGWTDYEKWDYQQDVLETAHYRLIIAGEVILSIVTGLLLLFVIASFI